LKLFLTLLTAVLLAGFPVPAKDLPFPIGEELVYSITWNGIPVAWSRAVTEKDTFDGKDVLAIRLHTRTYPFFDHIFRVDDVNESLIDPGTLLPVRYAQNLHEGRYECNEVTTFDFGTLTAHYRHLGNGTEKTYDIQPDMRDVLSFMYFMRSVSMTENTRTEYRVMSDEKVYELIVTTFGMEPIGLPHYDRKVPSLRLMPEAMFDGLFVRKGKATVWVSRDDRRLLTFAKLKVPFGRVRVTLQEVNGPGEDFWITEKEVSDNDKAEQ
jgi:hypothetical protein